MKARLPQGYGGGGQNVNNMMKQAQKLQDDMAALQKDLAEREFSATSGGGMVSATVTGDHELRELKINPEIIDPSDAEMLQDMVIAAVNEAMRTADSVSSEEMSKLSGGFNIPGLSGLL